MSGAGRETTTLNDPWEDACSLIEELLATAPSDTELRALAGVGWVERAADLARRRPTATQAVGLAAVALGAADLELGTSLVRPHGARSGDDTGGRGLDPSPHVPTGRASAGGTSSASRTGVLAAEARRAATPDTTSAALVAVSVALAAAGEVEPAIDVLDEAERRCCPWSAHRGAVVEGRARVAEALARAGHRADASALVEQAEAIATALRAEGWREDALATVATGWARLGHLAKARRTTEALTMPWGRVEAWLAVAGAEAEPARARAALERAEVAAQAESFPDWRAEALCRVVRAFADQGHTDAAAGVVGEIGDPVWRAEAEVARAAAAWRAGDPGTAEAHETAARAAATACGYRWWHGRADGLRRLARARAATRDVEAGLGLRSWVEPDALKVPIVQGAGEGLLGRRPCDRDVADLVAMTAAIRALDPGVRRLVAALDLLRIGGTGVVSPGNGAAGSVPPRAPTQRS